MLWPSNWKSSLQVNERKQGHWAMYDIYESILPI